MPSLQMREAYKAHLKLLAKYPQFSKMLLPQIRGGAGGGGSGLMPPIPISSLASLETIEQSSVPFASNRDTTLTINSRYYNFFTLPTTEKWYIFTALSSFNGATVAGNIILGIDVVNANPPTVASTILIASTKEVAMSGASQEQKIPVETSKIVRGGSICGVWQSYDNLTATFNNNYPQASENTRKNITHTNNPPSIDYTAWTGEIVKAKIKAYFRGLATQ